MQHLDEGTIHAWLDDALDGDEAAGVASHVDACSDCAALVAEARGMIAAAATIVSALDGVRGGVIPTPAPAATRRSLWRRLRFTPVRAALAATLLMAAGTLLTIRERVPRADMLPPASSLPAAASSPAPVPSSPANVGAPTRRLDARDAPVPAPAPQPAQPVAAKISKPATANEPAKATAGAPQRAADAQLAKVQATPDSAAQSRNLVAGAATTAGVAPATTAKRTFSVMQLEEGRGGMAASTPDEIEGCYQVRADSTIASATSGLPTRFALAHLVGIRQNVVRSVTADGRIDSLVPGGSWQRVTPRLARVRFAAAPEQRSLTLQLTPSGVTGEASVGNRVTSLPVDRISCRP